MHVAYTDPSLFYPSYSARATFLHLHYDTPCTIASLQAPHVKQPYHTPQQMDERKYKIIRKIGQGTFGKVYEAEDETGKKVAIKRVEKVTNVISREVDILKVLNHEFCLKLLDVFYTSEDGSSSKKFQNLVFDYHPQTLYRFIQNRDACTPQVAKILFYQLCLAIRHIHEKRICHRDITPNNILIASRGNVVLADFGSAKKLDSEHVSMSYVCSRYYRAPELLLGCSNYSLKVDIWAAGCILAEMLMGKPIFPGTDNQDQFTKIVLILGAPSTSDISAMKKNNKPDLRFPHIEPLYFGRLLPKTLTEPEIVADLLYGMLCYNPKLRLSIDAVLKHPFFDDIRRLPAERLYVAV
jgi:glycogen synthase kinase 3 beta